MAIAEKLPLGEEVIAVITSADGKRKIIDSKKKLSWIQRLFGRSNQIA